MDREHLLGPVMQVVLVQQTPVAEVVEELLLHQEITLVVKMVVQDL